MRVNACGHLDVECSQSDVVRLAAEKVVVTEVVGVQGSLRRLICSRLCAAKSSRVTTEITTPKEDTAKVNAALCQKDAGRCQENLNIALAKAGFPTAYADMPSVVAPVEESDNFWGPIVGTKITCIQNTYSLQDTDCSGSDHKRTRLNASRVL